VSFQRSSEANTSAPLALGIHEQKSGSRDFAFGKGGKLSPFFSLFLFFIAYRKLGRAIQLGIDKNLPTPEFEDKSLDQFSGFILLLDLWILKMMLEPISLNSFWF